MIHNTKNQVLKLSCELPLKANQSPVCHTLNLLVCRYSIGKYIHQLQYTVYTNTLLIHFLYIWMSERTILKGLGVKKSKIDLGNRKQIHRCLL